MTKKFKYNLVEENSLFDNNLYLQGYNLYYILNESIKLLHQLKSS